MAYQVSIFLENKLGRLERVTEVLKEADINIRNINLNHTASGWGILNLVVSNPELACDLLNRNGISAALRKIIVIKMADKTGGLDQLLKSVVKAGVNITNAHGMVQEGGKDAFFAIDVEDIPDAQERLESAGVETVPDYNVYNA